MRNAVIAALLVLSLALAVYSQEAKVIIISNQDAKKAATLYAEKLAADKDWDDFSHRMAEKYVKPPDVHCLSFTGNWQQCPGDGDWSNGIQFSDDFKAIVPAPKLLTSGRVTGPSWNWQSTVPQSGGTW